MTAFKFCSLNVLFDNALSVKIYSISDGRMNMDHWGNNTDKNQKNCD